MNVCHGIPMIVMMLLLQVLEELVLLCFCAVVAWVSKTYAYLPMSLSTLQATVKLMPLDPSTGLYVLKTSAIKKNEEPQNEREKVGFLTIVLFGCPRYLFLSRCWLSTIVVLVVGLEAWLVRCA